MGMIRMDEVFAVVQSEAFKSIYRDEIQRACVPIFPTRTSVASHFVCMCVSPSCAEQVMRLLLQRLQVDGATGCRQRNSVMLLPRPLKSV